MKYLSVIALTSKYTRRLTHWRNTMSVINMEKSLVIFTTSFIHTHTHAQIHL
jgi:hypothetical protein